MRPITRLYDSLDKAMDAVSELKSNEFTNDEITVVAPGAAAGSTDDIVSAIAAGWVLKAEAKVYAEHIKRGQTLVSVQAPYGTGVVATRILESFGPAAAVIRRDDDALPLWDEAAPLSSALRMPVLLKNEDSFSAYWNIPALTKRTDIFTSTSSIRALSNSGTWFSSKLGLPVLSRSGTMLSSMLGLPLLLTKSRR